MKSVNYNVYVHLDQDNGDVLHAKCNCKAGQGGCCKHVAALLYAILDFVNMEVKEIPKDLTCTQVGQKWHVPSGKNAEDRAVKFTSLVFEKAEEGKKRKRPLVTGSRDSYCATPIFAQETTSNELQSLVQKLRMAGKAALFCESLESNDYQPCKFFETSCSLAVAESNKNENVENSFEHLSALYACVPSDHNEINSLINSNDMEAVKTKVGISIESSFNICCATVRQSEDSTWYFERSKRITASSFGKVLKRRKNIMPTSLIKTITDKRNFGKKAMPAPLKWGIEHEDVAIEEYSLLFPDQTVEKCGFVTSPQWPWLGCSPDGIIMKDNISVGCIEAKCPYSKKDMTLEEACADSKFFMKITDGVCQLKKNHIYFYQCQGVLNILGLDWIDFIVFTNKELHNI